MTAEEWVPRVNTKGHDVLAWCKRKNSGPNHWWDCEVYQVAAAMMVGVRLLGEPERFHVKQARKRPTVRMPDGRPFLITER
jgi:hypothetical protein